MSKLYETSEIMKELGQMQMVQAKSTEGETVMAVIKAHMEENKRNGLYETMLRYAFSLLFDIYNLGKLMERREKK